MQSISFFHFFISSMLAAITAIGIIFVKNKLKQHLTPKWQYRIWILIFLVLFLPLLPKNILPILEKPVTILPSPKVNPIISPTNKEALGLSPDIAVWSDSFYFNWNQIAFFIWIAGVIIFLSAIGYRMFCLHQLKKEMVPIKEHSLYTIYEQCKQELNIKKDFRFYQADISSPMIFGLWNTILVLPKDILDHISLSEIKYVLYHEMSHYKNKDILINYVICFLQAFYWFQPFVWKILKLFHTEREIACDRSVLEEISPSCYQEYGYTILNFIESKQRTKLSIVNDIGGNKNQIIKRIESIALYQKETKPRKWKSILVFLVLTFAVWVQAPYLCANTNAAQPYQPEIGSVTKVDFSSYFTGYDGTFVLYNPKTQQYQIYNEPKSILRVSPDSTYKIYSALFGLDYGAITKEESTFYWDGTEYPFALWNQDSNLSDAMKNSVSWYFEQLDSRIGIHKLQEYFQKIGYGNEDLSSGINMYWKESSLKISPIEQIKLLEDFYFYRLDFNKEDIDAVKDTMQISQQLYGKTGTGIASDNTHNGWFIGYVQQEEQPIFFATYLQNDSTAAGSNAVDVTLSILKDLDIYNEDRK